MITLVTIILKFIFSVISRRKEKELHQITLLKEKSKRKRTVPDNFAPKRKKKGKNDINHGSTMSHTCSYSHTIGLVNPKSFPSILEKNITNG